jgi:hypothetical protein
MKNYYSLLIVLAIALVAVAVFAYRTYHDKASPSGINVNLPTLSTISGTLDAETPDSITITPQNGQQRTFSVSTSTQVVTQVAADEVGKSLAEISEGTQVLIQPADANATAAKRVTIMPAPVISNQDPSGPPVAISGTLLSTTTSSVTLKTAADKSLRVALTNHLLGSFRPNAFECCLAGPC